MIHVPGNTWKELRMDYLADRTKKLKKYSEKLELNTKQMKFVKELFLLLEDMAVITDDLTDAVDELDMRLLETEQHHDEDS